MGKIASRFITGVKSVPKAKNKAKKKTSKKKTKKDN